MDSPWTVQYHQRVLATDPIAYWMLDEKSGAVAYDLVSGRVVGARNGAHTGVTLWQDGIGDGRACPLYDGTNDYTNIYSASLASAFNGQEGSIAVWGKVSAGGIWTDAAEHRLVSIVVDANNWVILRKPTNNGLLQWLYKSGGTGLIVNLGSVSTTDWFHMVLTWSLSTGATGEMRAYYNGAQTGATQTGLGAWAGALQATQTVIGSYDLGPTNPWSGCLAHCSINDRPASADEIQQLYQARWS